MSLLKTTIAATVAAASLGAVAAQADEVEKGTAEVGVLTCQMTSVDNMVVFTKEEFDCTFDSKADDQRDQKFKGNISKIGVDLSMMSEKTLYWAVLASVGEFSPSSMEGTYVGIGANIAAGYGVGAKALIGGSADSIVLQPVSVSGEKGVGVALGVEQLTLKAAAM